LWFTEVKFLAKTADLPDGNFTVFRVKNANREVIIVQHVDFLLLFSSKTCSVKLTGLILNRLDLKRFF